MKINKNILAVVFLLINTAYMFAQHKPDREKIKTLKVAYITEQLDLTTAEAQTFWPIYNAHDAQMDAFREMERTQIYEKLRNMESLSDKDSDDLFRALITLENQKHEAEQKFLKEIQKVISAKKTFILLKSEKGFKRRLLQQYRQKHGGAY